MPAPSLQLFANVKLSDGDVAAIAGAMAKAAAKVL
jgi:hypothetical protein